MPSSWQVVENIWMSRLKQIHWPVPGQQHPIPNMCWFQWTVSAPLDSLYALPNMCWFQKIGFSPQNTGRRHLPNLPVMIWKRQSMNFTNLHKYLLNKELQVSYHFGQINCNLFGWAGLQYHYTIYLWTSCTKQWDCWRIQLWTHPKILGPSCQNFRKDAWKWQHPTVD